MKGGGGIVVYKNTSYQGKVVIVIIAIYSVLTQRWKSALCVFSSYFNLLICFQDSKLENETDISPIGTLTNYPIEIIIIIIIIHSVNP